MREGVPAEQTGKEALGEILYVIGAVAAPTHIGVDRISVGAAERLERFEGLWRRRVTGGGHHTPVGGRKLGGGSGS